MNYKWVDIGFILCWLWVPKPRSPAPWPDRHLRVSSSDQRTLRNKSRVRLSECLRTRSRSKYSRICLILCNHSNPRCHLCNTKNNIRRSHSRLLKKGTPSNYLLVKTLSSHLLSPFYLYSYIHSYIIIFFNLIYLLIILIFFFIFYYYFINYVYI